MNKKKNNKLLNLIFFSFIYLNLFFNILHHINKKIDIQHKKKKSSLLYINKGIIITKKNNNIEIISI
jgi:hypothetical protein